MRQKWCVSQDTTRESTGGHSEFFCKLQTYRLREGRYEMLVGVPPFYHKNKKKMYYLIKELPVKFPDPKKHGVEVSEQAQDLIS